MFKKITLIIWVLLISSIVIWLANNNGSVNIVWLDREINTDILTVCVLIVLFFAALSFVTYFLIKILSIKTKIVRFFKKDLSAQKDQIIKKYQKSTDLIVQFFLAINAGNEKGAVQIKKEIQSLVKNPKLEKLLLSKITQLKGNDIKSEQLMSELVNQQQ